MSHTYVEIKAMEVGGMDEILDLAGRKLGKIVMSMNKAFHKKINNELSHHRIGYTDITQSFFLQI